MIDRRKDVGWNSETLLKPEEILLLIPPEVIRALDGEIGVCSRCGGIDRLDVQDFENMAKEIRKRQTMMAGPFLIPPTMYRVTIRCRNGHERIWRAAEPEPLPLSEPDAVSIIRCPRCTKDFENRVGVKYLQSHPDITGICPSCLARQRGRRVQMTAEQRRIAKAIFSPPMGPTKPRHASAAAAVASQRAEVTT